MSALTLAMFTRMNGDATLTALLGTYNSKASVFTKRPLPAGFDIKTHGPYVLTSGESLQNPGPVDVKNSAGREVVRDIFAYTDLDKSPKTVEDIGERIRTLFHRQVFSITGFAIIVAEASGPVEADEDDALGRLVTVRLVLEES